MRFIQVSMHKLKTSLQNIIITNTIVTVQKYFDTYTKSFKRENKIIYRLNLLLHITMTII